ncbi:MAG: BrnT family toxin [Pseudomonadales bacterium]
MQQKKTHNKRPHRRAFGAGQSLRASLAPGFAIQFDDGISENEERFILLGMSHLSHNLVGAHCERGEGKEALRIISARKATKTEKQYYRGDQS